MPLSRMKISIKNTRKGEGLVYIVIWLVVFLMPLLLSRTASGFDWRRVFFEWMRF